MADKEPMGRCKQGKMKCVDKYICVERIITQYLTLELFRLLLVYKLPKT